MKYFLLRTLAIVLPALVFFSCGPKSIIRTKVDPSASRDFFSGKRHVYVHYNKQAPLDVRRVYPLLENELLRANYSLLEEPKANHPILVVASSPSQIKEVSYVPLRTSSSHSGKVGGTSYSGRTSGFTWAATTDDYKMQNLLVQAFIQNESKEIEGPIWEGFIQAQEDRYEDDADLYLRRVVENFGKDLKETRNFAPGYFYKAGPEDRVSYLTYWPHADEYKRVGEAKVLLPYVWNPAMARRVVSNKRNKLVRKALAEEVEAAGVSYPISYFVENEKESNPGYFVEIGLFKKTKSPE